MLLSLSHPAIVQRLTLYLREMYPLPQRVPMALLIAASVLLFMRDAHGWENAPWIAPLAASAGAVFFILLLLRLMDELKDRDIDRELFRDRPLPSGRVRESDIRLGMAGATVAYLLPHFLWPLALPSALLLLAYTGLMYVYFFIPAILRRNLLLNLATHNPVIPLIIVHLCLLSAAAQGAAFSSLKWDVILLFAAMLWSALFAWEIARKIRSPQEENAYVTYSRIFGRAGAVCVAFAAQSTGAVLAVALALRCAWPATALLPLAAGYLLLCFAYARFLLRPDPRSARLRPFAEVYALLLMSAVILGAGWPS